VLVSQEAGERILDAARGKVSPKAGRRSLPGGLLPTIRFDRPAAFA